MTTEEASYKVCPFISSVSGYDTLLLTPRTFKCISVECMAWKPVPETEVSQGNEGYCTLCKGEQA